MPRDFDEWNDQGNPLLGLAYRTLQLKTRDAADDSQLVAEHQQCRNL